MAGDDAQIADAAALHEIAHGEPLRMVAHHERLADLHAGALADLEELARLVGRERDRLLAQHVLPRLRGADRPRHVQVVRQRIVDRLRRRDRRAAPRTSRTRAELRAPRAARCALPRSREAIATIWHRVPRCIAGTTFFTAMFAAPRIPQRTGVSLAATIGGAPAAGSTGRRRRAPSPSAPESGVEDRPRARCPPSAARSSRRESRPTPRGT